MREPCLFFRGLGGCFKVLGASQDSNSTCRTTRRALRPASFWTGHQGRTSLRTTCHLVRTGSYRDARILRSRDKSCPDSPPRSIDHTSCHPRYNTGKFCKGPKDSFNFQTSPLSKAQFTYLLSFSISCITRSILRRRRSISAHRTIETAMNPPMKMIRPKMSEFSIEI